MTSHAETQTYHLQGEEERILKPSGRPLGEFPAVAAVKVLCIIITTNSKVYFYLECVAANLFFNLKYLCVLES